VPEREHGLLIGILLGDKSAIDSDIIKNFQATGTTHIIAVSGFNISILIIALQKPSRYLGRRWSFIFSVVAIVLFTIMTGGGASVVRAAIMGMLLLVANSLGRLYSITPALLLTAALMLLHSPLMLFYDAGFQLSFLATIGIVYGVPVFEALTEKVNLVFGIKTILIATLCANLITMPLLLYEFQSISIISPLINVLILPLVPVIMLLGFISIAPFFGTGFGFLTTWLVKVMIIITKQGSLIPYAQINTTIYHFGTLPYSSGIPKP
jgi:competence protein ComEC